MEVLDVVDKIYEKIIYPRWTSGEDRKDPEDIHERMMSDLSIFESCGLLRSALGTVFNCQNSILERNVAGIKVNHPLFIAAGFDKKASLFLTLAAMGFNVEVGSLTRIPYQGNPRPRIAYLPEDEAIQNWMAFPGDGIEQGIQNLRRLPIRNRREYIVGINIGASMPSFVKGTEIADYVEANRQARRTNGDYTVLNIGSPNTAGVKRLQDPGRLEELLAENKRINSNLGKPKPQFLKISDLAFSELDIVAQLAIDYGLDGIVATNTSTDPKIIAQLTSELANKDGGISGKPLTKKALEITRYLYEHTEGKLAIIRSGGVMSVEDYWDALTYGGADLVQVLTVLVNKSTSSPTLAARWNQGIADRMNELDIKHLDEIKGRKDLPYLAA